MGPTNNQWMPPSGSPKRSIKFGRKQGPLRTTNDSLPWRHPAEPKHKHLIGYHSPIGMQISARPTPQLEPPSDIRDTGPPFVCPPNASQPAFLPFVSWALSCVVGEQWLCKHEP